MTIVSYGFPSSDPLVASVPSPAFAVMWELMGHVPVVVTSGSFAPSVGTADRSLKFAAGSASGHGIYDVSDATTADVAVAAVTTTAKWYTFSLRHDWTDGLDPTLRTTIVAQLGTSTQAIAAGIAQSAGVLFDTPICLALATPGSATLTNIVDLRVTLAQANTGWMGWQSLTLAAGTLVYAGFGAQPQYRISVDGSRTELRGNISRPTFLIQDGALLFTLPTGATGAAPGSLRYHICPAQQSGIVTGADPGDGLAITNNEAYSMRGQVGSDGQCTVAGAYEPLWVSLDGWVFDH